MTGKETKMTGKEKIKDVKVKDDIRKTNYGENAADVKTDAMKKHEHVPYNAKGDTRNAQNTVENR